MGIYKDSEEKINLVLNRFRGDDDRLLSLKNNNETPLSSIDHSSPAYFYAQLLWAK